MGGPREGDPSRPGAAPRGPAPHDPWYSREQTMTGLDGSAPSSARSASRSATTGFFQQSLPPRGGNASGRVPAPSQRRALWLAGVSRRGRPVLLSSREFFPSGG